MRMGKICNQVSLLTRRTTQSNSRKTTLNENKIESNSRHNRQFIIWQEREKEESKWNKVKSIRWAKYIHKIVYKMTFISGPFTHNVWTLFQASLWPFRRRCCRLFWTARMAQIMLCLSTQYTHNFHPSGHGHVYLLHSLPKSFLLAIQFSFQFGHTCEVAWRRAHKISRERTNERDRPIYPLWNWYHDDAVRVEWKICRKKILHLHWSQMLARFALAVRSLRSRSIPWGLWMRANGLEDEERKKCKT